MIQGHLDALERKRDDIEDKLHEEYTHCGSDDQDIHKLKQERVHLTDEIERVRKQAEDT